MTAFNFNIIEKKWQNKWAKAKIFEVKEKKGKKKFYCLEMFAYPSGEGLHMGHAFNYTVGDIYARFMRMHEYNVLYPFGYDSLGLPAENAAIKAKIHPKKYTEKAILTFIKQQKALGLSYDWSRLIKTHDPEYYKWDQWIFLQMFKKGLAYKKKSPVNYCPKCKTVLANEQVIQGKCWRHEDTGVEIKNLEQWFFKITDYARELYDNIDKLKGWPEPIKLMQKNWIGKSQGIEIFFTIDKKKWPIFTTRPDTIYGTTFMVISAQHPELLDLVKGTRQEKEVIKFANKLKGIKQEDLDKMEKEGVFTGKYAINPINNEKIPIYVGNFVLAEYGSGMVMAVPAHDQRDFEFAKKYKLPIRVVIQPKGKKLSEKTMKQAYIEPGILVNSGKFNNMNSNKAIVEISKWLTKQKKGKKTTQYKLKDWLISRQRYWGTPIPIIYCDKCGIVPVSEKNLPIVLPEKVKFGKRNPLTTCKEFVNVKCPKCKGKARRETNTMDTFVNSSWYFLRYCDPKNKKKIFAKDKVKYWMPIDQYIGGDEHATGHLIYFRFYTKFLRDFGLLNFGEPVLKLFNQGMIHGSDGYVMSKSRGNIIDPLNMIKKYSADILRFYLVSTASPDKDFSWNEKGIEGASRFINKVMNYFSKARFRKTKIDPRFKSKLNKTIKEVTQDIEEFRYNLAIIKLRALVDYFNNDIDKKSAQIFLKLLHPFCPHITEELWHKWNKTFISLEKWPKYDEKKINPVFEKEEQIQEKLKRDIRQIVKIIEKKPKAIYIYVIPKELNIYEPALESIKQEFNCKAQIQATNNIIYDPKKKAKKAKSGKPAIYIK